MTLQHSPRPWTIVNDDDGWDNVVDAEGSLIAEVDSCSGGKDPDARVIAAAPDMLRLLRVLVPISESGAEDSKELKRWNAALKEANELIAKLDGDTCPDK